MQVNADVVYYALEKGCMLTPRSEAAKEWFEGEFLDRPRRGDAVVIEDDDEADAIIKRMEDLLLIYDRRVADMTFLEEFALYKAMAPGKNFQMLAPSLHRRPTPSHSPDQADASIQAHDDAAPSGSS